jgi:hypothetical protein
VNPEPQIVGTHYQPDAHRSAELLQQEKTTPLIKPENNAFNKKKMSLQPQTPIFQYCGFPFSAPRLPAKN